MPLPALSSFQREGDPAPRAINGRGVVPQAYLSYHSAKRACERAGKRLCTEAEWERACRGQENRNFPYGDAFREPPCNVSQLQHPAFVLHSLSSSGHLDPRLNLLVAGGEEPVLWLTGSSEQCKSRWGDDAIYDMVGNLDEWVADERGVFRGGFYARKADKGCGGWGLAAAKTPGCRACPDAKQSGAAGRAHRRPDADAVSGVDRHFHRQRPSGRGDTAPAPVV
jgi:formylglycine-generating enzyme required for sulfatase activity